MKFGLIGYPLEHSFSKRYFTEKFASLGLLDFSYDLIPLYYIEEVSQVLSSNFFGLNITIPYKTAILLFLNEIDPKAREIGAVNTLVRTGKSSWKGYNTDSDGFHQSFMNWIGKETLPANALILGSGGASKAISYVLDQLGISATVVSRSDRGDYRYDELNAEMMKDYRLIINTTPSGMDPDIFSSPTIPYEFLTEQHWVYDLIYNPANTLFLQRCKQKGARTKNGLEMLHIQAEEAWKIWKSYAKF